MDEKKKVVEAIRQVTGRDPITLNEMLNILIHPEVIVLAKAYIQAKDSTGACKKYQAPWNCALEAQAFAQTVYNGGWSTSMRDVIEDWCINCQARLYGDDPGDVEPSPELLDWLEDPTVGLDEPDDIQTFTEDAMDALSTEKIENPWVLQDVDGC